MHLNSPVAGARTEIVAPITPRARTRVVKGVARNFIVPDDG